MAYKRLFVDSDILLDLILTRHPFYIYSQLFLEESKKGKFELDTSVLVIANINYILAKELGSFVAKESIRGLIRLVKILPFENDIIDLAIESNINDFEDAIQNAIAVRYNCEAIITRNVKDYKLSSIPALTAEQFLKTL